MSTLPVSVLWLLPLSCGENWALTSVCGAGRGGEVTSDLGDRVCVVSAERLVVKTHTQINSVCLLLLLMCDRVISGAESGVHTVPGLSRSVRVCPLPPLVCADVRADSL